jgi:hypothetical protein
MSTVGEMNSYLHVSLFHPLALRTGDEPEFLGIVPDLFLILVEARMQQHHVIVD